MTGRRAADPLLLGVSTAQAAAVGALCGLAWAGALRAMMAELVRSSQVGWAGTFGGVLIPGAAVGALLAVAWCRGRTGRTAGLRWFALAPLAFALGAVAQPDFVRALLDRGLGAGGLAYALLTIAGGFAIGSAGPRWARVLCGALASAFVVLLVIAVPLLGGPSRALTEPRGAWLAVLSAALAIVIMLADSIPFRLARTAQA